MYERMGLIREFEERLKLLVERGLPASFALLISPLQMFCSFFVQRVQCAAPHGLA
jgi:hypothetical protein